MEKRTLCIVIPVYNDWDCFKKLIDDIDAAGKSHLIEVSIVAVDDSSIQHFNPHFLQNKEYESLIRVDVLRLVRNLGHQRAIAMGLSYADVQSTASVVEVMDADGEDRAVDTVALMEHALSSQKITFARRGKRHEHALFRFCNLGYRAAFGLVTGWQIPYGNFCAIPRGTLRQVVCLPEIWSHFAAGILRSRLPLQAITIDRGSRYQGSSKMNFVALVMHGLSAFSVFSDIVSVRLILFTVGVISAAVMGAACLVYVKYFTALAIPGWATTVGFGLLLLMLQSLGLLLSLVFNLLNSRTMPTVIPAMHFRDFILSTQLVYERK